MRLLTSEVWKAYAFEPNKLTAVRSKSTRPRYLLCVRRLSVLVLSAFALVACGGGNGSSSTSNGGSSTGVGSPPPAITVSVAPANPSVQVGGTQQFTATVTNTTNTAVTWQVNGTAGGNSTVGSISSSGLYTAPSTVPNPATVTVTAVSQADSTKSGSATVTVTASTRVSISISPASVTLAANATQQFTANVTGTNNNTVTWQVNGVVGGNSTFGTVSSTGMYTAPLGPPAEPITVTAVAQADSSKSASSTVTATFGKASVSGTYVFLITQSDSSSRSGFVFIGGTFQADGSGNITNGLEDANSSTSGPVTNVAFTGSYTVGADGRGSATTTDSFGTSTFSFALTSNTRGQLIEFDGTAVTYGFVQQQNMSAAGNLSGTFVFSLFGDDNGPLSVIGQLQLTSGVISGTEDFNSIGTVATNVTLSGSYTIGSAGHGRATVSDIYGTGQFAFYIIDSNRVAFVDIDASGARTAGTALGQTGTTFSNSSLSSSVFLLSGTSLANNGGFAVAGQFTPDGNGNFSSGVFDENYGGTLLANSSFTGTYSLAMNGRGVATVSTTNGSSSFIFWMASSTVGFFMESDSSAVANGSVIAQQGGPFSNSSLSGNYEFALGGYTSNGTTPLTAVGQIAANGSGSFNGLEDAEQGTVLLASVPVTGTYSIGANGRGTGTISSPSAVNYSFYVASPEEIIFLAADPNEAFVGLAEKQCSDCH